MEKNLEADLRKWLGEIIFDSTPSFGEDYQNDFKDGDKKAKTVLGIFRKEVRNSKLRGAFIYVSVGGADGRECEYALQKSEINKGIVLEFSREGADTARKRAESLMHANPSKEMLVFEGDATNKLGEALTRLQQWRTQEGLKGILVSCQAILHELPYRSPDFKMSTFFGRLFAQWENIVFVAKEPCAPDKWPEIVQLKVPGLSGIVIEGVARHIAAHHRIEGKITAIANDYVEMPSRLAGEILFKLLYFDGSERANYEMQESLTSFDPEAYITVLAQWLDPLSCHIVRSISQRLEDRYRKYKIQVKSPEGNTFLSTPNLHALVTGSKITSYLETDLDSREPACGGLKDQPPSQPVVEQPIEPSRGTPKPKASIPYSQQPATPTQKINIGEIAGCKVDILNVEVANSELNLLRAKQDIIISKVSSSQIGMTNLKKTRG